MFSLSRIFALATIWHGALAGTPFPHAAEADAREGFVRSYWFERGRNTAIRS